MSLEREIALIEEAAHQLCSGPASVSRDYRRRLANRILQCCARILGGGRTVTTSDRDVFHFFVQATASTACGVKVWEVPHLHEGKEYWSGRPLTLDVRTLRQAEQLLTCRACIDRVRAEPGLLGQEVASNPIDQIVQPEYRERFRRYLERMGPPP